MPAPIATPRSSSAAGTASGAALAERPSARDERYFQAVRLYSALEACVFTALLVVWIGGLGAHAQLVLGWCHGVGWIVLSLLVLNGCRRRVFPWPVLAATVSPFGPLGATAGIEVTARRRRVR